MGHAIDAGKSPLLAANTDAEKQGAYEAYHILHLGFILAPLLAGVDKFTHLLADWDKYLAPVIGNLLGSHSHQFMLAVGVIEIVAAIGVAFKPRIFAYVVAVWLLGIVGNLLLGGQYLDIALRDFGLALAALALARLSRHFGR